MRHPMTVVAGSVFASLLSCAVAFGSTITLVVAPSSVPDEQLPRVSSGNAPAGFGVDSWQGPATGKSNWHARYLSNGDYLSALFPTEAADLTIADLASISYFTNRAIGTATGRDWWIQIYTRMDGVNDPSWYGYKFTNNYGAHTSTGVWTQYSTDSGMTFGGQTLSQLAATYGNEKIEMISIQTNSSWNGFDGCVDGLTITLTSGSVGKVNFEAVPEPGTLSLLGMGVFGLIGYLWRRQR
jgi:hypothetical protein